MPAKKTDPAKRNFNISVPPRVRDGINKVAKREGMTAKGIVIVLLTSFVKSKQSVAEYTAR